MVLSKYLSIDESISYIESRINEHSNIKRSAKTIIKNAIDLLQLKPVFKFKGYGTLYRIIKEEGSKNSIEYKQVFRITGYFYDIAVFEPTDFEDFPQFSDLDKPLYYVSMAVVDHLVDCAYLTTHYLKNINNDNGYRGEVGKDSGIEPVELNPNQFFRLTSDRPVFQDFHQENLNSIELKNQDIFFKIDDLKALTDSFTSTNNNPTVSTSHDSELKDSLTAQLEEALLTIEQQSTEIKELKEQLEQARTSLPDDEDMNPKRQKTVKHLLNVLFYKAGYDTDSHSGSVNAKIVELSKKMNTPLTKKPVTYWIKEIQQLRLEKEED